MRQPETTSVTTLMELAMTIHFGAILNTLKTAVLAASQRSLVFCSQPAELYRGTWVDSLGFMRCGRALTGHGTLQYAETMRLELKPISRILFRTTPSLPAVRSNKSIMSISTISAMSYWLKLTVGVLGQNETQPENAGLNTPKFAKKAFVSTPRRSWKNSTIFMQQKSLVGQSPDIGKM